MNQIRVVGPDADANIRHQWGENLVQALEARGMSRKRLKMSLLEEYGLTVSDQAISQWCTGQTSPRPGVQAGIAAVLRIPAHMIFPIPMAERLPVGAAEAVA